MKGFIHSVFSGGTVDGPGIRFVVFMQGCALRCKYCHNPDSWQLNNGEVRSVSDLTAEIVKYKNYFGSNGGVTISGGEPLLQIDFVIELLKSVIPASFSRSGTLASQPRAMICTPWQ